MEESLMRSEEYNTDKIQVEVDLMEESMEELEQCLMEFPEIRFKTEDEYISSFLSDFFGSDRDSNL